MLSRNDAGEKKKGRHMMKYIDNIKNWTRASLEENIRVADDWTAGGKTNYAARAANVRTDYHD